MRTHDKIRVCGCCGEVKQTYTNFNWNSDRGDYSPNCKSCGCWLTLFRQVFGATRDWEANRKKQECRNMRKRFANPAANSLMTAFWGKQI